MAFNHVSVLLEESIAALNIRQGGTYVDGTLGGGGHGKEICSRLDGQGKFIGIDRDREALKAAAQLLEKYDCEKQFIQSNYSQIHRVLEEAGIEGIDGAILDLGVSSHQLDVPQRGFSYMQDAPLDMRMDQRDNFTAYDVVNGYSEERLKDIISRYGEEKWAARIAKFIEEERRGGEISSTSQLVEIIKKAIPAAARREGPHPAKRTFQAIRIEVNDELGQLEKAVDRFCDVLNGGGRLCIITFHSLEDRIVKEAFARRINPCTCPPGLPICACKKRADIRKITGKPIIPGERELSENPRSRSAKLRVVEKLGEE
jgi:16S rRNA (cytosine1402-N4)-methyltransferase